MGKYKRLLIAHNNLKEDFESLVRALKADGSIAPHGGMYNKITEGDHSFKISCAQVDANRALFRVTELSKHFGLYMKHTEIDKWGYEEREDTDGE